MQTEVVRSLERLEELVPEWERLWRADPRATPFQSPAWVVANRRVFPLGELFVVAVRDGSGLAALAPLFILRDDDSGESLGMLIGTGVTDYLDLLSISNEATAAVIRAMAHADCQFWDLQELRPDSPFLSRTDDAFVVNSEEQDRCPVLNLADAGPDLEGLVSAGFRKRLRYYRRLAERAGDFRTEEVTVSNLEELLSALFRLHGLRWQKRGLPGVLDDEDIQAFHRAAASALLDAGALRMHALRLDGAIVAVFYGFAHNGTAYYYLSGYDPALEKLSLGTQLVAHAIAHAIGDGATAFDFMRGAEEYKYAWGAVDRVNSRRQFIRMEKTTNEDERGASAGLAVDPV